MSHVECVPWDRFVRSWMAALQVVLVCGTLLVALGLVPFLYFVAHWYLMQGSPLETWDSPPRSLIRRLSSRGERGKPLASDGNRGVQSPTQQPEKSSKESLSDEPKPDGKQGRSISFQELDSVQEASESRKQVDVTRGADEEISLHPDRRRSSLSNTLKQSCSSSKVMNPPGFALAHLPFDASFCADSSCKGACACIILEGFSS